MKKALIAVFILCCSMAAFAKADLQFGLEAPTLVSPCFGGACTKVTNHVFFGENQMFGFGESIGGGCGGSGGFTNFLELFVGPAFGLNFSKEIRFQAITGLRYFLSYWSCNNTHNSVSEKEIGIDNAVLWGNDVQIKFSANRFCSFVVGTVISIGTDYKTLKKHYQPNTDSYKNSNTQTENFAFEFSPYLAFSINFGN